MPEDNEITVGDVVMLKSGGPAMTVSSIGKFDLRKDPSAMCDWFVQDKAPWKQESGSFPLTSLRKVKIAD